MPDDPELEYFKARLAEWEELRSEYVRIDAAADRIFDGTLVKLLGTDTWKALPEECAELYAKAKARLDCGKQMEARELAGVQGTGAWRLLEFLTARAGRKGD